MAGEPGQIVLPDKQGTINLSPEMWKGLVTGLTDHYDYFASGTEGQQAFVKQLSDQNVIRAGTRSQSNR